MLPPKSYVFKLYLSSAEEARSKHALAQAKKVVAEFFEGEEAELLIVDINKTPYITQSENIITIPTLRRLYPKPEKDILNQFSAEDFRLTFGIAEELRISKRKLVASTLKQEPYYTHKKHGDNRYRVITQSAAVVVLQNLDSKVDVVSTSPVLFVEEWAKHDPRQEKKKASKSENPEA